MKKDKGSYLGTPSQLDTHYKPSVDRYTNMGYRRCGRSGIKLPLISLGLWQNFGDEMCFKSARETVFRAFDLGITCFDLANNYGNPPGSAEIAFGRIIKEGLCRYRDQLIISTKAGYDMWPGPYGEWGSKKYLVASINQSLDRLGIEYVDIFYSHRYDPQTPLSETMEALDFICRQGKALYVGISSYGVKETLEAYNILKELRTPFIIHQSSYSLFNRWIETTGLLEEVENIGLGCITFTSLEQGLLTDKYVNGIPRQGRMVVPGSLLKPTVLSGDLVKNLKGLSNIAKRRRQTLAQMAIAWVLRDTRVTSTIIGARTIEQIEENVAALCNLHFTDEELKQIDQFAVDMGITLWPPNC